MPAPPIGIGGGDFGGGLYGGVTESFFWDSRVEFNPFKSPDPDLDAMTTPDLAALHDTVDSPLALQALFPVTVPEEMRGQPGTNELADATSNALVWKLLMVRLVGTQNGTVGGIQGYRDLFKAAYPGVASFDDLNCGTRRARSRPTSRRRSRRPTRRSTATSPVTRARSRRRRRTA
jgi:hypothetical protein